MADVSNDRPDQTTIPAEWIMAHVRKGCRVYVNQDKAEQVGWRIGECPRDVALDLLAKGLLAHDREIPAGQYGGPAFYLAAAKPGDMICDGWEYLS